MSGHIALTHARAHQAERTGVQQRAARGLEIGIVGHRNADLLADGLGILGERRNHLGGIPLPTTTPPNVSE